MIPLKRNLVASIIGLLLLASIVAAVLTRQQAAPRTVAKTARSGVSAVDESLLETARRLASEADSPEEQAFAQQALHAGDNAVTQAFAIAIREAALSPRPASGPLKDLADRIGELRDKAAATKAEVDALSKSSAKDEAAQAKLDLARAQLVLDQEELSEAQEDLARQGGDRKANLERLLKSYQASQKAATPARTAHAIADGTLLGRLERWWDLRDREDQLRQARLQALGQFALLAYQRGALSNSGASTAPPPKVDAADEEETAEAIERLRRLSDVKNIVSHLDQGMQDAQLLAEVYKRWSDLVITRQRDALHLVTASLSAVLAILFLVVITGAAVRRAFRNHGDRRRAHQMRLMLSIAAQITGVLVIALIVFGPPTQLSTVIGLTTAGLTVVLKDFIVAFFGWFVLMGKNGVRIGDWVEIEGVGGEVVEIGLLKTVLLEMGNWTSSGHPTGRRVSFMNKFAIENHFFNFSTAGQWLWDELQVTLPQGTDAYTLAMQIRERVEKETEEDARLAEHDWERVTRQYDTTAFSGRPAVDLRPSGNNLTVVVQYITRAPRRYEVKSRLFQAIVEIMHKPSPQPAIGS